MVIYHLSYQRYYFFLNFGVLNAVIYNVCHILNNGISQ